MSIAENSDGLAAALTHGGAAQDLVIQLILPYASAFYETAADLVYPLGLLGLIATFVLMAIYPMRFTTNFFLKLVLVAILLAPATYSLNSQALWFNTDPPKARSDILPESTSSIEYPKSVVILFSMIGVVERSLYDAVDAGVDAISGGDSRGALPQRVFSVVTDSAAAATGSGDLVALHRLYQSKCGPPARAMNLSTMQLQSVGLQNGLMMGSTNQDRIENPTQSSSWWERLQGHYSPTVDGDEVSNDYLSQIKASASSKGTFTRSGSFVPSSSFYKTVGSESGADTSIGNFVRETDFGSKFSNPNAGAVGAVPANSGYRFFAQNCDELHDIVQIANRNYYGFVKGQEVDKGKFAAKSGWSSWLPWTKDRDMSVVNSDDAKALAGTRYVDDMLQLKRVINSNASYRNRGGFADSEASSGVAQSAFEGVGLKLVDFWKSMQLSLAAIFAMGVVALGIALIFAIFPLVIAFSVLPGRLSAITTALQLVVFGKLTLLLMYLVLRVAMMISAAANFGIASSPYIAPQVSTQFLIMSVTTQMVATIVMLTCAPMLSYVLVFSETKGLASLQPGGVAQSASRAALGAAFAAFRLAGAGKGGLQTIAPRPPMPSGAPQLERNAGAGQPRYIGRGVPLKK